MRLSILALLAVAGLALAGSGDTWAAKATKLTLKDSPYGEVVFARGYAMYVFTRDAGSRSRCYGRCAKAWPPLRHRRQVIAGRGIDPGLIGKTKRRDGSKQITYAGRPLYGYVHDPRGRVLCHDVPEFGGTWYAVQGSGEPAP
jgi:predicted lipoprotein with Yx(FWY)xxD motif